MITWFKTIYLKAVAFVLALIPKKGVPVVVPPESTGKAITQQELDNVIEIVNKVRSAAASPIAVILTDLVPTTIDNTIRLALVNGLPILLAGLMFAKEVLGGKDQQAAIDELLEKVRFSDKPEQDALWHSLASRLLIILSDGRVTWSEAVQIIEYYYKNGYGKTVAA